MYLVMVLVVVSVHGDGDGVHKHSERGDNSDVASLEVTKVRHCYISLESCQYT